MKIQTSIYRKRYYKKPTESEIANRLQSEKLNLLKVEEIELSELCALILQGRTFRPCAINGTSDSGFISGQLIGIDIDNDVKICGQKIHLPEDKQLKPKAAIAIAKENGLYPIFVYGTFSDNPKEKICKYRMLFCLDRAITDVDQWRHAYLKVARIFGQYPDPACKNPSRLFFGTNKKRAQYTDLDARIDANSLLADYVPTAKRKAPTGANTRAERVINIGGPSVDIVTAVQNHDADFIRKTTKRDTPIYFNCRADMFHHIYQEINLADLLNVSERTAFSCIIPGHEDEHPSASVFRAENGNWLYQCQSAKNCPTQGLPLTVKQLFEHIGQFESEAASIEFLRKGFNLHIVETDYTRQQKENLDEIIKAINSTDETTSFSAICPTAAKNTRYCHGLYTSICVYAKEHIQPDTEGTEPFAFYMPIRNLIKKSDVPKSLGRTDAYIKMLIYHTLIEIVPFSELPEDIQKNLKAKQTNGHNVCQYYRVPSWTHPHLLQVEDQAKKWTAAGYRLRSISYEGFYRSEGPEVANKLYPQRQYKKPSDESDRRHDIAVEILLGLIESQGYATEKEVCNGLKEALIAKHYKHPKHFAEGQVKKSITEVCNSYGLTKSRCNKDLKAKFNVPGAGYPTIIYRE